MGESAAAGCPWRPRAGGDVRPECAPGWLRIGCRKGVAMNSARSLSPTTGRGGGEGARDSPPACSPSPGALRANADASPIHVRDTHGTEGNILLAIARPLVAEKPQVRTIG